MEDIVQQAGFDARKPTEAGADKVATILRTQDRKGIWLAVPSPLGIDMASDASVLVFDYYDTAVRGRRYLNESGVIIATRIESRETRAALIEELKPQAGSSGAGDSEPLGKMNLLQQMSIPLRQRLPNLTWRKGTYIIDVMLDAQMSNRARIVLNAGLAAERDPAVAEFIERQTAVSSGPRDIRPAPSAAGGLPIYRKTDRSLPVPNDLNISLSAERVSVYRPDARNVLRGSYRLAVPSALYRSTTGIPGEVTAVVAITLVITGNLMTGPFVAPLRVPTYDLIDASKPESVVTGHFEIDLFALPETSKVPQTYRILAYSGEVRSAPAISAVVTPQMMK